MKVLGSTMEPSLCQYQMSDATLVSRRDGFLLLLTLYFYFYFQFLRYGYFEEIRNDQNYFTPSSKLLWEMQMSIHPPHAIVNEENKMKDSKNSSNYRVISNAAFPFCFYSSEPLGKTIINYLIGSS